MYMSGHAKLMPCRLNIGITFQFTVFREITEFALPFRDVIRRFPAAHGSVYTNGFWIGDGISDLNKIKRHPDYSSGKICILREEPQPVAYGQITKNRRTGTENASEVKIAALELGLPVLQPEKLKAPEFVEAMQALKPDLGS